MNDTSLLPSTQHLLSLAKTIRHYEEALTRANGERFNLFEILHVGDYERTHTLMLTELLNPEGSHGQRAVFLQHFLTEIGINDFTSESARVESEVFIGLHGRLDIKISHQNHHSIFIENKIYADLQKDQLIWYHKYDHKAKLLLLTLEGDDPTDWKTNTGYNADFKGIFRPISYKFHIVRWLESCRKEAATVPSVREAITQYIHLIQRLTQQNTSTRMNEELIKAALQDKDTYLAYAELRNADWAIRSKIIEKLNTDIRANLPAGLVPTQPFLSAPLRDEGYVFSTPGFKDRNLNLAFGIVFDQGFFFGFRTMPEGNPPLTNALTQELKTAFESEFGLLDKPTPFWPAWNWMPNRYWDDEVFADIQFNSFYLEIIKVLERLKRVADKICPDAPLV